MLSDGHKSLPTEKITLVEEDLYTTDKNDGRIYWVCVCAHMHAHAQVHMTASNSSDKIHNIAKKAFEK